jgi:hypothetical protein
MKHCLKAACGCDARSLSTAGLSALIFDCAVGGADAQSGGWVAVLPDRGATLGLLWVPILAGSPLEAPGRPLGPHRPHIPPWRAERRLRAP